MCIKRAAPKRATAPIWGFTSSYHDDHELLSVLPPHWNPPKSSTRRHVWPSAGIPPYAIYGLQASTMRGWVRSFFEGSLPASDFSPTITDRYNSAPRIMDEREMEVSRWQHMWFLRTQYSRTLSPLTGKATGVFNHIVPLDSDQEEPFFEKARP